MARARDILYRFRPAGAPGGAGAAGVPVDRGADLEAELAPVFARLAGTEAACDSRVEQARREALDRHARDTDTARAIIDAARTEAASERAAAALSTRHAGEAELDSVREAARREAEEILRRAAERMPRHVERVVERVRAVGEMRSAASQGGS